MKVILFSFNVIERVRIYPSKMFGGYLLHACEGGSRSKLNDAILFSKHRHSLWFNLRPPNKIDSPKTKTNLNISWFLNGCAKWFCQNGDFFFFLFLLVIRCQREKKKEKKKQRVPQNAMSISPTQVKWYNASDYACVESWVQCTQPSSMPKMWPLAMRTFTFTFSDYSYDSFNSISPPVHI